MGKAVLNFGPGDIRQREIRWQHFLFHQRRKARDGFFLNIIHRGFDKFLSVQQNQGAVRQVIHQAGGKLVNLRQAEFAQIGQRDTHFLGCRGHRL